VGTDILRLLRSLAGSERLLVDKRFARREKIRIVDAEDVDRNAARRRFAAQGRSGPFEMIAPIIYSRMKESNNLTAGGIRARDVRPFVPIAVQTGEGQIFRDGPASVLPRNDVVDVKRQRIDVGGKVAILTSTSCTLMNLPDNGPDHER
jgi:hypothetical protein